MQHYYPLLVSFMIFIANTVSAQYPPVVFNYERSQFNDGRPLPSETYFSLSGAASLQVSAVEIKIYGRKSDPSDTPYYSRSWKREYNNRAERFEIPVTYRLRSEQEYDIYLQYYRPATIEEVRNVRDELYNSLDAYVDQNLVFQKKRIALVQGSGRMVEDLNSIVSSAMSYYKAPIEVRFAGFSDLVLDKINVISKTKQDRTMGRRSSEEENMGLKAKHIKELKVRIHSEVAHLLNTSLSVLADTKYMPDTQAEKVRRTITLHGGLGGAYADNDLREGSFGASGMAGLTLPLGKKAFAFKFWGRTAIMMGVSFQDFDGKGGSKISGPIVERPFYLGLGYQLFQPVRLTVGASILENTDIPNGADIDSGIYFRPYLGITVDLSLWLGLGK